ncbi:MAG: hypothetical protein ACF8AM_19070 [Rhodopirellula sp. JB055]|uniref:hypothetical protein n=1 Tax=Rhodopirellula sp. JB055 TaxID=3342846 RepID=UPI00370A18C3
MRPGATGAKLVRRKIQSFTPHHFFSKARLGQRCEAFIDRVEQLIHNAEGVSWFFHNPTRQRGEVNIVFPSLTPSGCEKCFTALPFLGLIYV